jgi:anti-anti-sigma factor
LDKNNDCLDNKLFSVVVLNNVLYLGINPGVFQDISFIGIQEIDLLLKEELKDVVGKYSVAVIDLTKISFINSVGVSYLLLLRKNLMNTCKIVFIHHASSHIESLIKLSGLSEFFTNLEKIEDAQIYANS